MVGVFLFSCGAREQEMDHEYSNLFSGVTLQTDSKQLLSLIDKHQTAERNLVDEICAYIEKSKDASAKSYYLFILGKLNQRNSIPTLVKYIDFKNPDFFKDLKEIQRVSLYPAVQSLIELQGKSINSVCEEFKNTHNSKRRALCLLVLDNIFSDIFGQENYFDLFLVYIRKEIERSGNKRELHNAVENLINQKEGIKKGDVIEVGFDLI